MELCVEFAIYRAQTKWSIEQSVASRKPVWWVFFYLERNEHTYISNLRAVVEYLLGEYWGKCSTKYQKGTVYCYVIAEIQSG